MLGYFLFFLISGFCGILYELVWLRLAMAQFGVTTPLVSIVLSTFMGGLGAGSWLSGRMLRRYHPRIAFPPLRLYALTELVIGCSAFVVPREFSWGHRLLESLAQGSVSSATYYAVSAGWIALSLLPWCFSMGATIPLAMLAIRSDPSCETRRSFSFLYLANLVGALFGTLVPLLLIERYGFLGTLRVGAALNLGVAIAAWSTTLLPRRELACAPPDAFDGSADPDSPTRPVLALLFMTGLTTMAMELVWIRLFTVYVGPLVYSFALILGSYLFGTFAGSAVYRSASVREDFRESRAVWVLVPLLGALPLLLADPRLPYREFIDVISVLAGVAPFAAAIGYLTPMLIDRWSLGDADKAGHAYAANILGCIAGPLLAGFVLLPLLGEHWSLALLLAPWVGLAAPWRRFPRPSLGRMAAYGCLMLSVALTIFTKDYEILFAPRRVLRDRTATVTATGSGMSKELLVNGVGMTHLQPETKIMAHLTLASSDKSPKNVLIICFGMGTTHRSVISWGVSSTAVELVPSVPKLFSFFHSDGDQLLASPLSHVVVDDGRRYLERSTETYDAIIIDPPPPVSAAGSSLLYSKQFYQVAHRHLREAGILQQWLPLTGVAEQAAVARALEESFPQVRVLPALGSSDERELGWHFLASQRPIPMRNAQQLVERMPASAIRDMMEWGPAKTPQQQFEQLLSKERTTAQLVARSPNMPAVEDDRPVNEYFLLRTFFPGKMATTQTQAAETTGAIIPVNSISRSVSAKNRIRKRKGPSVQRPLAL